MQEDWNYVQSVFNLFKEHGGETYIVELEADLDERILRNKTENRLQNKTTESYGTSPSFPVPDNLVQKVLDTNLSEAMDIVLGEDK